MTLNNQLSRLFFSTLVVLFTLSCSSSDDSNPNPGNGNPSEGTSSYSIDIEGVGNFSQDNISLADVADVNVAGLWFESPEHSSELLTCTVANNEAGFTMSSSIILQEGSPAPVGSPLNFNEENPQISIMNIQNEGTSYFSKSGSIQVSNLELIPEEIPDTPGETALANYSLTFTGQFDIVETTEVEESIEISGEIVVVSDE